MAYQDLRSYLERLENEGLLKRVSVQVSTELEISEISSRVVKRGGPSLLFENVKGYSVPVVTNLFGSEKHICCAFEVRELEEISMRIKNLLDFELPDGIFDKLRSIPRLGRLASFKPRRVKKAPCQEIVLSEDDFSLEDIPVLRTWPLDGGPFITLPLVFTRDPLTGKQNAGMYRMQVFDGRTTGMHWHRQKDGARNFRRGVGTQNRMEVAVALGGDPATIYAATAPVPPSVDEMLLSGFLRQEPVDMVKCHTIDLEVPAQAEIVLEGYVNYDEKKMEGPFGDHTGFYSPVEEYPVFHVKCMTRRSKPIYPATIVGRPPMEDYYLGKLTERLFLPLIQLQLPEVVDMHFPPEGVFHNCVYVSINKSYPGQARKVMHALWGMGQMMFTKTIIVVDSDVDVHDSSEVLWRLWANVEPSRDFEITRGPLDDLDHASTLPGFGYKIGFDATCKTPEEGYCRVWPEEVSMSREIKSLVDKRWREYGIEEN